MRTTSLQDLAEDVALLRHRPGAPERDLAEWRRSARRKAAAKATAPDARTHRLQEAVARLERARHASALERLDAKLELKAALIAARRELAGKWVRAPRSGLALRSEYRGQSERRVQFPIGRDAERRGARSGLEVRSSGAGLKSNEVQVTGAAVRYGVFYEVQDDLGTFSERMLPGVASEVLAQPDLDCRFLCNHSGIALARTTTGSLRLWDTSDALCFSATLDTRSRTANDVAIAVARGDLSQCSIGFVVADDSWSDDWSTRSVSKLHSLQDVSVVSYPASPTTHLSVVSGVSA